MLWLLLWHAAYWALGQELLLPSPLATAQRLAVLALESTFWKSAGVTLLRILAGWLLGNLVGILLGILTAASEILDSLFRPLATVVKATPVASIIILALIWLQKGTVPVFAAFLMVLPIVWSNVREGVLQTPRELREMVKLFHFTKMQRLCKLYLPQTLPYFYAGCMSSVGLAWKAGIAAEVLSIPVNAIGTKLYDAKIYLETTDLFAWTILVILLSVALEYVVGFLLKMLQKEGASEPETGGV